MTSAAVQQYLDIEIQDNLKYDIRIENAHVESGEFYREGDRSDILSTDDIDDMSIRHNGGTRSICSRGDTGSNSGPRGTIDLVDDVMDIRICTLAWRASMDPGKPNIMQMSNQDPRYNVNIGKWNKSGTMGEVPVVISEK
ncbi:hypothetical protein P175DRAFT_0556958 [Aspergillus ochraceoroseus IBT 24754]|uniref:Asp hemolysin-like protein n=3 Tax=Aspergillus subgen. Nidulantes TaxID=2720870 RepID=A0A0F8UU61_9EURO|nr:uncharacterized protein P175DRAFT_0556958 [Aspergillus ochraceoroseus IBT 24754]KKK14316.1 hypothetical protein ARAM_000783 [Aspergillus rambellii]KKK18908.1 hypothetical protein AOCH_000320 [Aspergillus ochraceoroseus]PTU22009.1 hypothetical protein P175DRAFT_0556958 [Aspergillus ochraceoroseus IBT 24754]